MSYLKNPLFQQSRKQLIKFQTNHIRVDKYMQRKYVHFFQIFNGFPTRRKKSIERYAVLPLSLRYLFENLKQYYCQEKKNSAQD